MVKGKDQLQKPKLEVRFLGLSELRPRYRGRPFLPQIAFVAPRFGDRTLKICNDLAHAVDLIVV